MNKTQRLLMTVHNNNAGFEQLRTTWYPALRNAASSRASIAVVGDSITDGYSSTNFDTVDYVSLLRSSLQASYGDGGEGFIGAIHSMDTQETGWEDPPSSRWSFGAGGAFVVPSFDTRDGWGAMGGAVYWNATNSEPQITGTFDKCQIMTGIKFDAFARDLIVTVDGGAGANIAMGGGAADHSQFAPGTITEITKTLGEHTVKFDATTSYVFFEGIRFLKGTAGVVVDRFAKAGMRAEWLGNANDADYTNYGLFYKTLYSTFDVLDEDLFIIMLGLNDYNNQTALSTFETALTVIANRAKAKADTVLVVPPKPNSSLTIPFSSYVAKIKAVAAATGCLCLDVYERWGSIYNTSYMQNNNHPNNAGHADIASYIFDSIK